MRVLMKNAVCLGLLLALSTVAATAQAAKKFVEINGGPTRARVSKVVTGDLRAQNRLTAADVNGTTITALGARKATETQSGFTGYQRTTARTYVAGYTTRAGNPKNLLITVSAPIMPPKASGPAARYFVARAGKSGDVVARGYVTRAGKVTWTRGRNGDGLPERNLAD